MKNNIFKYLVFPMVALSLNVGAANAKPAFKELPNHVPTKAVSKATLLHHLEAGREIHMNFVLPLRNQKELQDLISRVHNPADTENFGKYLTTAEFIERFAPTQADYDKVVKYANSIGMTVQDTHPNRTLLHVSGQTEKIEAAFNVQLHQYMSSDGRQFYAPNKNPEVHPSVASTISGIVGLDNSAKWHSYLRPKGMVKDATATSPNSLSGPGGAFGPKDIAAAYNLTGLSANGANQVIALFELGTYNASDITAYASYFGLPTPQLQNILVDGGSPDGIDPEVALDIELALAVAPQSTIYVYIGPNSFQGVLDTYNRIATDNIAKQVSTSWGLDEQYVGTQNLQAENAIFQQMAVQGQTIYAAAGDSGAYDDGSATVAVDDPASQPYMVGVGGTTLSVDATTGAYVSESVWNNGSGNGAGGGGVSTIWPIPSWQSNVTTVYSKTQRNVPDVSLDADPNTGYSVYYNGGWWIYGGTSCAAPLWAAYRLRKPSAGVAQRPVLGFANPTFYAIGLGSSYGSDFHDVTTGNNLFYSALKGYDNATGWGSFNGGNLFTDLTTPMTTPVCSIVMKHSTPFIKRGIGTYHLIVTNTGNGPTSGPVNVAVSLPPGLIYNSFYWHKMDVK